MINSSQTSRTQTISQMPNAKCHPLPLHQTSPPPSPHPSPQKPLHASTPHKTPPLLSLKPPRSIKHPQNTTRTIKRKILYPIPNLKIGCTRPPSPLHEDSALNVVEAVEAGAVCWIRFGSGPADVWLEAEGWVEAVGVDVVSFLAHFGWSCLGLSFSMGK